MKATGPIMNLQCLDNYDLGQLALCLSDVLTLDQHRALAERIPAVMQRCMGEDMASMHGVPYNTYLEAKEQTDAKQRIVAIKIVRTAMGWSLKEAKEWVDKSFPYK